MPATVSQTPVAQPPVFDTSRRFVRVNGIRANGFVEFEFAIGEPGLFVEMILDRDGFDEFCRNNRVVILDPDDRDAASESDWDWRLADATRVRFK